MEENNLQIAEDIRSGKYFVEAKNWYNRIFVRNAVTSAATYLYAYIAVTMLLFSLFSLFMIFPVSSSVKIVKFEQDTLNFETHVTKIDAYNPEPSVIKFLCKTYVENRESYTQLGFQANYRFVWQSSSDDVFRDYYSQMQTSNQNSPIVLTQNGGKIVVNVTNIKIKSNNTASVEFTKNFYDKYNIITSSKRLVAELVYYIQDIDFTRSTNQRIEFMVTKYSLTTIAD